MFIMQDKTAFLPSNGPGNFPSNSRIAPAPDHPRDFEIKLELQSQSASQSPPSLSASSSSYILSRSPYDNVYQVPFVPIIPSRRSSSRSSRKDSNTSSRAGKLPLSPQDSPKKETNNFDQQQKQQQQEQQELQGHFISLNTHTNFPPPAAFRVSQSPIPPNRVPYPPFHPLLPPPPPLPPHLYPHPLQLPLHPLQHLQQKGLVPQPYIMHGSPEGINPSYNASSLSLRPNPDELDANLSNGDYYSNEFDSNGAFTPTNYDSHLNLLQQQQQQQQQQPQQQHNLQQHTVQQQIHQQQDQQLLHSNAQEDPQQHLIPNHNSISSENSSHYHDSHLSQGVLNVDDQYRDLGMGESDDQYNQGDFQFMPNSTPNFGMNYNNDNRSGINVGNQLNGIYLSDQNTLMLHTEHNPNDLLSLPGIDDNNSHLIDGQNMKNESGELIGGIDIHGLNVVKEESIMNNNALSTGNLDEMNYGHIDIDTNLLESNQPKRSRASGGNLIYLNQEFSRNANPGTQMRREIAKVTGMTERSVRIWFQNKRAKVRKLEKLNQLDMNGNPHHRTNNNYDNLAVTNSISEESSRNSLSSLHNSSKLPIQINEKYSLVDCLSISVGTWQRIKSGYINPAILKNLGNLSPRLLNNLMLTTDLLIVLSKRDNELNYFFSGVFQNEKVLFRIFFPLSNILSCSLINNHTQRPVAGTDGPSKDSSNNNNNNKREPVDLTPPSNSNSNAASPSDNDPSSSAYRNSSLSTSSDAQLRMQLAAPPKFAVHFLRDPTSGRENPNQWSICEDFSEGQQVMNAYIGEGGTEAPHVLSGDVEYLQFLNSAIVSFNQNFSNMPLRSGGLGQTTDPTSAATSTKSSTVAYESTAPTTSESTEKTS